MPNIVYVLTNPAMPGIVKIGMTDSADVQRRMDALYTTGVPLPFDCVVAWEVEGRDAVDIERALHTAFGPVRINPSREFFQVDSEQVEVLLRVMPGRDVTPWFGDQSTQINQDDREAASEFKRRQNRTSEVEFLESLDENGKAVYERILALGQQEGMRIKWGSKGFSLNVVVEGDSVVLCYGFPLTSVFRQSFYTDFGMVSRKANLTQETMDAMRADALNTGIFELTDNGNNLMCRTQRTWDETELTTIVNWLREVAQRIQESRTPNSSEVPNCAE